MHKLTLLGQVFGKLTVISDLKHGKWRCACLCGGTKIATSSGLNGNLVKSCGCLRSSGRKKGPRYPPATVTPEAFKDTIEGRALLDHLRIVLMSYGFVQVGRSYHMQLGDNTYGPFPSAVAMYQHAFNALVRAPAKRVRVRKDWTSTPMQPSMGTPAELIERERKREARRAERIAVAAADAQVGTKRQQASDARLNAPVEGTKLSDVIKRLNAVPLDHVGITKDDINPDL